MLSFSVHERSTVSRKSIIAEIRKDVALMEHVIKLLGGVKMVSIDSIKPRKTRTMSAAARRRISKAQKARWAKWKAAKKG